MRNTFHQILNTESVERAQERSYGRPSFARASGLPVDGMGSDEREFIAARDSFYMASVGEGGWPYVQHRGGPKGFLRVLDDNRLAFADYSGNRHLFSAGNVSATGRVALFLMDYAARERLKIIGRASIRDPDQAEDWLLQAPKPERARVERVFLIEVVGFDWNCPKFITPRFTADEVEAALERQRSRIAELEKRLEKYERDGG